MTAAGRNAVLLAAAFLSGLVAVVYEVVWSRYLTLIFGSSFLGVAATLAGYMLGLALGSRWLGARADGKPGPLRIFVRLQLGLGLLAGLSPLIYAGLSRLSMLVMQALEAGETGRILIRCAVSGCALVPGAALAGGMLPALVKAYDDRAERVGAHVAVVYAINTLGGAAGAFLCGFVLIENLGLTRSLACAALLSGIVALAVRALSRRSALEVRDTDQTVGPRGPKRRAQTLVAEDDGLPAGVVRLAWAALAVSSFTALANQLLWTRVLTLFFRDSVYDFAIVLTTFLLGIAIGSLLVSCLVAGRRRALPWLAAVEVLIGLTSLAGLFVIARLPYWAGYLQTTSGIQSRFGEGYWWAGLTAKFGFALAVMLPPTVLYGAAYPLVARMSVLSATGVGRTLGTLGFYSTLGAVAGPLAVVALLAGGFGTRASLVLLALLNAAAGLVLLGVGPLPARTRRWGMGAAIGAIALALAAAPAWDRLRMSTSFLDPNQPLEEFLQLLYYRESAFGITSVVDLVPYAQRYLSTNRVYSQNTSAMGGLEDHRRLGHIPMLLHRRPSRVLVVGLGAGITLRAVAAHEAERIDCVEISADVGQAARLFSNENGHVLDDHRVRLLVDDGRSYLGQTRATYDVIVGDLYFPMSSGSASLYSVDYFRACRRHLAPGGLMSQWLPLHQLSWADIGVIVRSFEAAFPHTSLWYGMIGDSTPALACIGAEERLAVDFGRLRERYDNEALVAQLEEVNLGTPALLLSHFVVEGGAVARTSQDQRLDNDDRPVIEFSAPRLATAARVQGVRNLLALATLRDDAGSPTVPLTSEGLHGDEVRQQLEQHAAAKRILLAGLGMALDGRPDRQLREYRRGLEAFPLNPDLLLVHEQAQAASVAAGTHPAAGRP